jgi:hypothetical protein
MRVPALPILASLALFAAPAFAQSSTATPTSPSDTSPSTSSGTSTSSGSTAMNGDAGKLSRDTQQKVRQSLEQSGFKDISVAPESFVIRAQAPDGSHIVMMMSPDVATGVIEHTGSSTEPGTTTPSTSAGDTGTTSH